jgi:hypothetical protein
MSEQTFFWHRLRWRLRGAWLWPAFAAVTLGEGVLLWRLPPVGTGLNLIEGMLLATFGNLVIVAAIAPWLARRLAARRRPAPNETEREVLKDRVSTGLLLAGVLGVVASGLAARPTVVVETEAREQNAEAVREFVLASGSDELMRNLETANTVRLGEGYFRTCIARDDRERFFCVFVDTDRSPPEVVKDPSEESNSVYKVP